MSQPRAVDITSIKPTKVRGLSTTAQLFVSFAKSYFGVPDKSYDSALAQSTNIYAGFGQLVARLSSLTDDDSVKITTREILDKLKGVNTPSAKTLYESLMRDADPILQTSEELQKRSQLLHQKMQEDREAVFKVLHLVLTSKDPNSQEIVNQLKKAQNTHQAVKLELENFEKARTRVDAQLRKIAASGFTGLPSQIKTSVSLPPPAAATPTLSSGSNS